MRDGNGPKDRPDLRAVPPPGAFFDEQLDLAARRVMLGEMGLRESAKHHGIREPEVVAALLARNHKPFSCFAVLAVMNVSSRLLRRLRRRIDDQE